MVLMMTLMRDFFPGRLLPEHLAILSIQGENHKLVCLGRLLPAHSATTTTAAAAPTTLIPTRRISCGCGRRFRRRRGFNLNFLPRRNRRQDEDLIFPHDG